MRTGKLLQLYLDVETHAALAALAERMRRTMTAEVAHAIERHLQAPPRVHVPPLADGQSNGRAIARQSQADPAGDDLPF